MERVFFTRSSADGHLGGFHVLAVVSSAAVNIGMQVSFQLMFVSGWVYARGGLQRHSVVLFLVF